MIWKAGNISSIETTKVKPRFRPEARGTMRTQIPPDSIQQKNHPQKPNPSLTKEITARLRTRELSEPDRSKAIVNLMNQGDATCVPVLIEHMGTNHSYVVRQNAMRALGKIGDSSAVPVLLAVLSTPVAGNINDEGEEEAGLRRNAVAALRDIGDPKVLPILKNIMAASREYQSVRDLAANAIRKIEELHRQ